MTYIFAQFELEHVNAEELWDEGRGRKATRIKIVVHFFDFDFIIADDSSVEGILNICNLYTIIFGSHIKILHTPENSN